MTPTVFHRRRAEVALETTRNREWQEHDGGREVSVPERNTHEHLALVAILADGYAFCQERGR